MRQPRYIGGFFELEQLSDGPVYHSDAIALSNGRACFSLILDQLKPKKVYMPFYSCDALYEPLRGRCDSVFYQINKNFEIADLPALQQGEYLVYINYFGVKETYVDELKKIFGTKLIIDETHNFFRKRHEGHWSFCSARKYFGVPDGAYLYSPKNVDTHYERNSAVSLEHLINRKKGYQELAFKQFQEYENSLDSSIKLISDISEKMLSQVDYETVRKHRRANFEFLDRELACANLISFESCQSSTFCYPLILDREIPKHEFYTRDIFIPTLWSDVLKRNAKDYRTEKQITKQLTPLPIDHRYRPIDLKRVTDFIHEFLKNEK